MSRKGVKNEVGGVKYCTKLMLHLSDPPARNSSEE